MNPAHSPVLTPDIRRFREKLVKAVPCANTGNWLFLQSFRTFILLLLAGFLLQQLPLRPDSFTSSTVWCQEAPGANDSSDESGLDEMAQKDFLNLSTSISAFLLAFIGLDTTVKFAGKTISVCTGPFTPPPEDLA